MDKQCQVRMYCSICNYARSRGVFIYLIFYFTVKDTYVVIIISWVICAMSLTMSCMDWAVEQAIAYINNIIMTLNQFYQASYRYQ